MRLAGWLEFREHMHDKAIPARPGDRSVLTFRTGQSIRSPCLRIFVEVARRLAVVVW